MHATVPLLMFSSSYMDATEAPQYCDYDPLPLISALNLILQHYPTCTGFHVGKNHFSLPSSAEKFGIGPGIQAMQGFYASVRPAHQQLMVNVYYVIF
jgi:eukaryotic translation initiation factor 2C